MKNNVKYTYLLCLFLFLSCLAVLAGCDSGDSDTPEPKNQEEQLVFPDEIELGELESIYNTLERLNIEGDPENEKLMQQVIRGIGAIDPDDTETLIEIEKILEGIMGTTTDSGPFLTDSEKNEKLRNFAIALDEIIGETNFWLMDSEFLNIAHRGGGLLSPEDTIVCYKNALDLGADAIEGDCHRTKDGVMVISHDATVDRCTNGNGAIEDLTFEELRMLDAGYWFTSDGQTYPYRGKGIKIPTVREVFQLLTEDYPDAPMILEIKTQNNKEDAVDSVLDLIEEYDQGTGNLVNRLQMGAFNQEALDLLKHKGLDRGIDIVRCFSIEGVLEFLFTPIPVLSSEDYEFPGDVLALPTPVVTRRVMDKARNVGLKVNVWTVNSRFMMQWLIHVMKVDGIMTDNPALLHEILER